MALLAGPGTEGLLAGRWVRWVCWQRRHFDDSCEDLVICHLAPGVSCVCWSSAPCLLRKLTSMCGRVVKFEHKH